MHWWVATMALLYVLSGITIIKADEVAIILRWGRLVGDTPALQEHGPGLLFALPRPVDRVVRVQVKHVWETEVRTLAFIQGDDEGGIPVSSTTLDPLTEGYAITGDENILHLNMVARYRVKEPAVWALYGAKSEDVLRAEVSAAMVRSLGEMGVDRVLSDGRKDLINAAARRTQAGLDAAHSGLELSSLELIELTPPFALANDFNDVQSAFIAAQTLKNEAQGIAASEIPWARADADASLQSARGRAASDLALAKGDAGAFLALDKEYRANPVVVRERLYRDAVERAIGSAGKVQWVPPPDGGSYRGFRITVQVGEAGGKSIPIPDSPPSGSRPGRGPVPPPGGSAGGDDDEK
jgi:membrane protease subunit HflK